MCGAQATGLSLHDIESLLQLTFSSEQPCDEVLSLMRARLLKLLSGPNAGVKAAATIRVAISHYVVRSDDGEQFLAQLRHAAAIKSTD